MQNQVFKATIELVETKIVKKNLSSRLVFLLASLVVIIAGLKSAKSICVPFLFAIFLSILGFVPLTFLKKIKIPTWIAVLIIASIVLGAILGTGVILSKSVNEFSQTLPDYKMRFDELTRQTNNWIRAKGFENVELVDISIFSPNSILEYVSSFFKSLASTLSSTFIVIILMIFMLLEAAEFSTKLNFALGDKIDFNRFQNTCADVQRYLAIKTSTSLLTGLLVGSWTYLMGLDFYILWGFIAFLLNYIPFVGSTVASVPAILLATLTHGPSGAITIAIGYLVVNILISNFIEPIFMGRQLGLSPLVVLLSLIFWGWVWGPGGALMSVPLTMIIKILLENNKDLRWLSLLLDNKVRKVETI